MLGHCGCREKREYVACSHCRQEAVLLQLLSTIIQSHFWNETNN